MAEGRMIRKRIAQSKKLGLCKSDSARLLYFMMYPHADVEGRLEADIRLIKGQIIPLFSWSCGKIRLCLEDLHHVGLITLYNIEGNDYLEFSRFSDFQRLRTDREAKSEIPPIPKQLHTNDGSTPGVIPPNISQVKLSKEKRIEEKITHPPHVSINNDDHKNLVETYGIGPAKEYIERLNDYAAQFPAKFAKYASHYATIRNWMRRDKVRKLPPKPKPPEETRHDPRVSELIKATKDNIGRDKANL